MPVDFFIAGVQKAGTTALDRYLRAHPQVQMATVKEVHYFDNETVDWNAPDYSILESFFDWSVRDVIRGEATPIYIYWPDSLKRLHRYNAAAKLIIGLRHPSYRAFSHWRMMTSRGLETLPFEDAICSGWQTRKLNHIVPQRARRFFSYLERGHYAAQIKECLSLFPRQQVYFYRADALWCDHDHVLREIQAFLNVDESIGKERCYISPINTTVSSSLVPSARKKLDNIFRQDILATEVLTGLDLSDWLDAAYEESIGRMDHLL